MTHLPRPLVWFGLSAFALVPWGVALAPACGGEADADVDTDSDTDSDSDTDTPGGLRIEGFTQADCGGSDSGTPSSLTATWEGDHAAIGHHAVRATCCVQLVPEAHRTGHDVSFSYREEGDPCDCMCNYDLSFDLSGLDAGTWTLSAEDADSVDETTLLVP